MIQSALSLVLELALIPMSRVTLGKSLAYTNLNFLISNKGGGEIIITALPTLEGTNG